MTVVGESVIELENELPTTRIEHETLVSQLVGT